MNKSDERLLMALIDGEADAGDRHGLLGPAQVAGAATLPASLLTRHAVLRALSDATRSRARRHAAPRAVLALPAQLARQAASDAQRARAGWPSRFGVWLTGAAVSGAAVAVLVTSMLLGSTRDAANDAQLISAHLRSLMSTQAVDVASADSHTVKPWFSGRLGYAPPVEDFAAQGFTLVGGRLEVFDQQPVAALVYRRKQHLINLFVLPTPQAGRSGSRTEMRYQGFNLAAHKEGEFTFIAVSDLNMNELNELLRLAAARRG